MDLAVEAALAACLVVFAAYVVFGVVGFGSTLVAVPLLAHFYPLRFVIPVIVLVDCLASLHQGFRLRGSLNRRDLAPMLPFVILGLIGGALVLASAPGAVLLPLLGVFVTAYGLYYAARHQSVFRVARWTAAPIGLAAGTTSSLFGMGGPLYVMYLAGRGSTPDQIRATMPVIFIFTSVGRILLFGMTGLITLEVLAAAGLLLPIMALGLWCGDRWHARFTRENVVRAIGAVLTVSGLSLLVRAF